MSLYIDTRAGSSELIAPLTQLGLPVEEKLLKAGDLMFVGRGERGAPLAIGVEHKKLPDLIQAMNDGRLLGNTKEKSGQIPRMVRTYDRSWLIAEGDWERSGDGKVATWARRGVRKPLRGAPHAIELRKRLLVVELRWGVRVIYTKTRRDTLDTIYTLYRVWTDKDLDEHRSHLAVHAPDADTTLRLPMSNFRGALKLWLPGIGFAASKTIEEWVTTGDPRTGRLRPFPELLFRKTAAEWTALELPDRNGKKKRLGEKRAKEIMEELGTWGR